MQTYNLGICVLLFLGLFAKAAALQADVAYAQLSSLVIQTPAAKGRSIIKMDSVDAMRNMEMSADKTKVVIKDSGVYLIMAAAQVGATSPGARGYVDIWLIKNDTNVSNSNTRMSVDTSASTGVLVCQSVLSLKAGDMIATGFSASGPELGIVLLQPDKEPAIPSIIFSILKIDTETAP
ncbi:MAG TPA: hypothetical protein VIS99_12540 [Terrimicrobiaceae bacterium]